jgi:hypothetical protein
MDEDPPTASWKVAAVNQHSRRNFLRLGALTAGTVAVAPALGGSAEAEGSPAPAHDGAFVAWVKNPGTGEIAVLVGDQELNVRDRKLAKCLAQAAARAQQ